jgi:hypothetical protein
VGKRLSLLGTILARAKIVGRTKKGKRLSPLGITLDRERIEGRRKKGEEVILSRHKND